LENGKSIKLILTFPSSLHLLYVLETKEHVIEKKIKLDIPVNLTQYIHVRLLFFEKPETENIFQNFTLRGPINSKKILRDIK